jgi:RNA polymerase sigma-70 factor (ECF subfamily)
MEGVNRHWGVRVDFTSFYKAQAPRLVRTVAVVIQDPALAEEVVAEAFARAWVRWPQVRACQEPAAWVMRVALNQSRDRFRRGAIERRLARVVARAEVVDDPPPPTDWKLWEAVRGLPDRERTLVALRYLADLTQDEIAQVLGIPSGTVASGLHRARRRLAAVLGSTYEEEFT